MRLRVLGLRRSGQHAIITWLAYHFDKNRVLFLNNIDPKKGIFSSKNLAIHKKKIKLLDGHDPFITTEDYNDYDLLIYSHEERNLHKLLKTSDHTILVLRDAYNMTASRLMMNMKYKEKTYFNVDKTYVKFVKQYLKEGIGKTNIIKDKTVVNFNKWKMSKEYRKNLSESLGLEFIDIGYNKMTLHGTGSSFDGVVSNASELKVLDRWKELKNNVKFKEVFNDKEVVKLSYKFFESNWEKS